MYCLQDVKGEAVVCQASQKLFGRLHKPFTTLYSTIRYDADFITIFSFTAKKATIS